MPTSVRTRDVLEDLLSRRILVLDGAMGSTIYAHEPTEEDYRGSRFRNHRVPLKNCTEVMVLTQPRLIEDIHRAYLEAGSDIISTDTFNGNGISLAEFDLQEQMGTYYCEIHKCSMAPFVPSSTTCSGSAPGS
jgi:5-methyltetrahydrofolate--homocysteine methyltransferase